MRMVRRKLVLAGVMAPAMLGIIGRAAAQKTDYYKDKVVTVNIAGGAAGGHNRYARMIQPYLQKHSGARELRMVNMQGGGGLKAANFVWRAKPDGLNIF